ncbi:MAG TPA: twin-arginine translocase TatA/TatE family subunit [Stellaceae bacterium]|nr:twin-arginine translocase TatA/TatE family subunit [Stellaceae bacterium]
MGGFGSIWHWLLLILVVAVLFGGRGKIAGVMGDFAKGIKAFKAGMKEEDTTQANPPPQVTPPAAQASAGGATATAETAAQKHG